MSLDESRILTALIRAKARLALGNGGIRSRSTDVSCPNCGMEHRASTAMDGVDRGNPYHVPSGEHGGEFTSGPGSGRLKALAKFKKEKRDEAKDLQKEHRQEWKETLRDQRRERNKLRQEQKRERSKLVKEANKKLAKLSTASVRERNQLRRETKEALQDLADQHQTERQSLLSDQKGARETVKAYHKEAWESFKFGIGIDAASEGFKKKSRTLGEVGKRLDRTLAEVGERLLGGSRKSVTNARKVVMSSRRTSKASSAEAILRQCLRSTGLTAAWQRGELTVNQHVELQEEIRQYGRAWLRHEANEFVRPYATRSEVLQGVRRASSWVAGPGGLGGTQDSGFRHSLGRFVGRVKSFVRELILSATLALSGPAPLTGEELAGADQEAQKQAQYFDKFHQEVIQPPEKIITTPLDITTQVITVEPVPLTPSQFVARAEKYADSAWQGAQRINREQAIKHGIFRLERRVLGNPKTEHCDDCPPLAAVGWQPIGTLPFIGDSACGPLCLCHFRYSEGKGQPEYFQGNAGALRAPK